MSFGRSRQRHAHIKGTVPSHSEAVALVGEPGDLALVERGTLRSMVMRCPDGCGEAITVNLDPKTDKAWRIYKSSKGITLYPSVWRDTGCRSHFILWNDVLYWLDDFDRTEHDVIEEATLDDRVWDALKSGSLTDFVSVADSIQEIPWAVLDACRRLVRARRVIEGKGSKKGSFRRL